MLPYVLILKTFL